MRFQGSGMIRVEGLGFDQRVSATQSPTEGSCDCYTAVVGSLC